MAYEWFISYRRKSGGENQARQVAEILTAYVGKDKVFYDRESMREGNWRNQINDALKTAEHFVLLVNEASAAEDQSNNIGGYRYEIEYALKNGKNITLIEYDKKSYENVTAKYPSLNDAQKVTFNGEYNFAFEERLCKHFGFKYKKPSSAPSVINNISYPENLIPRRDMLNKLNNEFKSHKCVVVSGIGGSGKTSLAYLYAKEQKFNNIAWVIVNGKIEDVFVDKIAGLLFSKEDYADFTRIDDTKTKLDIIKSELSKIEGKNLLVFDINTNNEAIKQEIESELYNYLPAENWKTLILTRARVINATRFSVIEMGSMAEEDTINLFKNNYGGDIQFTDMQLAEIAQELYYHPLLIEQTAIYFSDGIEDSAEEIIDKIKDINKVNNERTNEDLRGLISEGRKEKNIKNYLLNLCNIENLSPEEVKFLAVYVTWPTEPISKEIIKTLLPGTEASLRTLIKKGIISHNSKQFSIHSLMADVIREQIRIKEFDYSQYFENIADILNDDEKSFVLHNYSKYIANSLITYNLVNDVDLFAAFLNRMYYIGDSIILSIPENKYSNIIKKMENMAKPRQLATLYNAEARIDSFKKRFIDAKKHYKQGIEVCEKLKINDDILSFKCTLINNLALLETDLGEYKNAQKHFEEVLSIRKKMPQNYNNLDRIAKVYNNLGTLKCKTKDFFSSIKYYEIALKTRNEINDESSAEMHEKAKIHNNIAFLNYLIGNHFAAKTHFDKALSIRNKIPMNPALLNEKVALLYDYALFAKKLGDINSAKTHLEEGLEISSKIGNEEYIKAFEMALSVLLEHPDLLK